MLRLFRRASFTARLLALAAGVLVVLVVIDYVALLELPGRVAQDTVEIALRENVQSLNATFADERADLRTRAEGYVENVAGAPFRIAVLEGDEAKVQRLAREALGDDVRAELISGDDINGSGIGPVNVPFTIQSPRRNGNVVLYRLVDDSLLERAAAAIDQQASFAVELDGEFVARSGEFPTSLAPADANSSVDPGVAELSQVRVDDENLHLYSRAVTSNLRYRLHALSTRELERTALADVRDDVRTAIAGMSFATIAAFMLLLFFTGRTVRSFAIRVRALADGDYGTRLQVRGSDAFADLASSVNRLSEQLSLQLGRLEDTASAFSRTLETLEEGICVWDEDGAISYWNRGAEQLSGLARERASLDDPIVAFLHAERAPGTRRVTLPVRRSGGGLVVDLVVTAMPGGGIVQTFRDTTMVDMLQQTQRNFMATAAHELRTPITTILGFADTLVNPELELTDRQRDEFLAIIRDHAHQLQEISDAFFTNHQLANERVEVSIVPALVDGVVEDALERVRMSLPDRAVDIDAVTVDVPARCAVLADRRALVGVVAVLVENALKYGSAPITVAAERKGGTITVLVRDEGPGIETHHHARLFDPFYRIDVDMRSGVGGAGLGLFTARKLVEAMHGAIRVRSVPGRGATFVVELPAAPVETGSDDDSADSRLRLVG
jgi:two-component system phosphate regulon sensor histidine kinase PhoR